MKTANPSMMLANDVGATLVVALLHATARLFALYRLVPFFIQFSSFGHQTRSIEYHFRRAAS